MPCNDNCGNLDANDAHVSMGPGLFSVDDVRAKLAELEDQTPKFEFQAWPKTMRQYREIVVSEKLDGSNAAIQFSDDGDIAAQSRKRLIKPGDDNFAFAHWAYGNKEKLFDLLGPGIHFGEWYGRSIQRTYGLDHKRFALFNIAKWGEEFAEPVKFDDGTLLTVPPVLYRGVYSDEEIRDALKRLHDFGSVAVPDFMNPEGLVIFHTQTRLCTKYTLDDNDDSKYMRHE